MRDALNRIRLSGELSGHLATLEGNVAPVERVRLGARILELLAQLGETLRRAVRRLAYSKADPQTSRQALADYLADGLDGLAPALVPFERDTVAVLAQSAGLADITDAARSPEWRAAQASGAERAYLDVLAELSRTGITPAFDAQTVMHKHEEAIQLQRESYSTSQVYKDLVAEWSSYHSQTNARMHDMDTRASQMAKGDPERESLLEQLNQLVDEYKARRDEVNARNEAAKQAFDRDRAARINELFETEGRSVLDALQQASPVTQEQAEAWAAQQEIDAKTLTKLVKLGYPEADLRRDMAEFYRLCGGKASTVRLSTDGGRRANAVGIDTKEGEKVINIGTSFSKAILFHELAHHLENDPIARAGANGYLLARRESEETHRLRDLTGHQGYGKEEIAYKDSFINPYMGKVYAGGITEVFSLGVEYLASPRTAAIMAAKDPQLFALISGYLTRQLTPAMAAKLDLHAGAIDDLQQAEQRESEEFKQALRVVASRVTLQPCSWYEELDPFRRRLLDDTFFKSGAHSYLGAFGNYHVFAGTFRNKNSGRNAKGHLVVRWESELRPETAAIHGGLDLAKAFIVLHQDQGLKFHDLWYAYFFEKMGRSPRRAIISTAQAIQEARP